MHPSRRAEGFLFFALRCIASQQAKTPAGGSSCARISTPPREARVRDPGPAAQGIVLAAACMARLRSPRFPFDKLRVISGKPLSRALTLVSWTEAREE